MSVSAPLIYRTTIRHHREEPVRHGFTHRSVSWLVDLDDLPRYGPLAAFEARDHFGAPERTLRENIDAFLDLNRVELAGGQVLMLTGPRVFGYCFNPISVFWCHHGATGDLVAVVVEVHNTYGDQHAYLVHPDARGRATVAKSLYVSPFNDADGHYALSVPEPGEEVAVTVTLHRAGRPPFSSSLRGPGRPATTAAVLSTALRRPFEPLAVRLRIQNHGLYLLARGLRIHPRPAHRQEAVQ